MPRTIAHQAQTWRAAREPPPPEQGLDRLWLAGQGAIARLRHRPAKYLAIAHEVVHRIDHWRRLADTDLRGRAEHLKHAWRRGSPDRATRLDSLSLVREQSRRRLGLDPFPVQIAAAAAILEGCLVEMATGEGKTLVAALAAVPLAWQGRGCHVLTANDYLVERDANWMTPLHESCGVSVGFIGERSTHDERQRAYDAGVTYATSKELAADVLRDRLLMQRLGDPSRALFDEVADRPQPPARRLLLRGLNCAIVDEADSLLIDEAVTPLILSGPATNREAEDAARDASALASRLAEGVHYRLNRRHREIRLTPAGRAAAHELAADLGGVWKSPRRAEELTEQALTARDLHLRDRHYVVNDGRVVIVDEFTGRPMPDRQWRAGLHQAVEAKERLTIQPMRDTVARISFQRFFRSYRRIAGMTGTARECRAELWTTYRLPVVRIPTNLPCRRRAAPAQCLPSTADRNASVLREIGEVHAAGRPILVGTRTVEASEALSASLHSLGIAHHVLNAVRHADEAAIIARAGEPGAVTIATNMAGRGTDIRLAPGVAEHAGLHVILTEPHASRRIDRQFAGRAARQGDPGSSRLFFSMDDEVISRHAAIPARLLRMIDCPHWAAVMLLRFAQARAQSLARRERAAVMRADDWLHKSLGFASNTPTT